MTPSDSAPLSGLTPILQTQHLFVEEKRTGGRLAFMVLTGMSDEHSQPAQKKGWREVHQDGSKNFLWWFVSSSNFFVFFQFSQVHSVTLHGC